jgi:hypothetical protein
MYPTIGSSEEIPSYNDTYTRAGLIYRDIVLACPTYWMARAAHKKSYVGEYSIPPAKHASDTIYVRFLTTSQRSYSDEYIVEPSQCCPENSALDIRWFHRSVRFFLPDG